MFPLWTEDESPEAQELRDVLLVDARVYGLIVTDPCHFLPKAETNASCEQRRRLLFSCLMR